MRPTEDGLSIELIGEIAHMVTLSAGAKSITKEPYRSSVKVVAGERNQRYLQAFRARVPRLRSVAEVQIPGNHLYRTHFHYCR